MNWIMKLFGLEPKLEQPEPELDEEINYDWDESQVPVSQKASRILRRMGLDDEAIARMNHRAAWDYIYENTPKKPKKLTVCFTGFTDDERPFLRAEAERIGMAVRTSVNGSTGYLCIGSEPGPSKMRIAKEAGVPIITKEEFLKIVATGELPE